MKHLFIASLLTTACCLLPVASLFSPISLSAAEIKYDSPQTFYAGRENIINIKTDGLSGKNLAWNLKYSGLTIAAAELAIPESGTVELKFTFPEIKEGVSVTAEFNCASGENRLQKNIFFFPANPFSLKKKQLEKIKIGLWSPEGYDIAKKSFESRGVVTSDIANFAEFKGEILIITGIDFGNFSGLDKDLVNICLTGANVIIINPKAGSLSLRTESFKNLILARNDKVTEYDKKFDSEKWGDSPPNGKFLNLIPLDTGVGIEISEKKNTFTFMSAKIGKGELLICTWDIFGKADKSPSPLYLLDKIITESEKRRNGESEKN